MSGPLGQLVRRCGGAVRRGWRAPPTPATVLRCHTAAAAAAQDGSKEAAPAEGVIRVSKSMQAYQQRAKEHDEFMVDQNAEFEIGRRHLANIMGEDPETFTQEDIDAAIQYLLPSGLFEPRARPAMKPPAEVHFKRKAAEFDISGRPFHSLFYTGLPQYYQALHDLGKTAVSLEQFANKMAQYRVNEEETQAFNPGGSEWVTKEQLEDIFLERLQDKYYNFFMRALYRLVELPYSSRANDFIMRFRRPTAASTTLKEEEIPKLMYTTEGIPYMTGRGNRKRSEATVTVYGRGSGKFDINGQDMRFFSLTQYKEQVVFPLQFTGLLGKVDLEAKVTGNGPSTMSGAIRLATAQALQSFVDDNMRQKMRLAGLLTWDRRHRERKKPGQKGARAKFTWKKR